MTEKRLIWEDVAPYVVRARQSSESGRQRAGQIAAFVKRARGCEHVEVRLRGTNGPGPEYGSCTHFFVLFDEAWRPIGADSDKRRFSICMSVSERGPFITASGSEWRVRRQPRKLDWEGFGPTSSEEASSRAKALALEVADEFGFKYVDAEWLRQFKLNPKELPWDDVLQSLDIDTYEPTALNLLFDEEM